MPELPEVEVVRRGLARWLTGRRVTAVEVLHPRPVRRHVAGAADFADRLAGVTVLDAVRRGKYLWLELDSGEALLGHLGMSGQLLLQRPGTPDERHLRVRATTEAPGADPLELRFVDQRMFGGMSVVPLLATPDGLPAGTGGSGRPSSPYLPPDVVHIARDPLDPHLDTAGWVRRLRSRRTGIKRALLDQTLLSGVGNIYADEALWRSRLHFARPTETLTRPAAVRLLDDVRDVMTEALHQGGTSFDALYVNVNGESGYFDRSLAVYGQAGRPCPRCGTPVRRDAFMNRSSFTCPRCQPRPRHARW
ncbi:MAG: bifunctional DNA-formamidopyrimidine glycosylase/DNA-(apurinic or apyrimidinic site) lyase [Actinomycetota bacterium]